ATPPGADIQHPRPGRQRQEIVKRRPLFPAHVLIQPAAEVLAGRRPPAALPGVGEQRLHLHLRYFTPVRHRFAEAEHASLVASQPPSADADDLLLARRQLPPTAALQLEVVEFFVCCHLRLYRRRQPGQGYGRIRPMPMPAQRTGPTGQPAAHLPPPAAAAPGPQLSPGLISQAAVRQTGTPVLIIGLPNEEAHPRPRRMLG